MLPSLGEYDVVYLGDVVEHQEKPKAWTLLEEALSHARLAAIVTIPIGDNWPQATGSAGNPFHAHRSRWYCEDFDRYPEARREAFSDHLGRMYLVAELPGHARTDSIQFPAGSQAQPVARIQKTASPVAYLSG